MDEPAGVEAGRDAEALGCGGTDPPGIRAMPMAPTEQAVDEPDPVLAAPAMLHCDEVWASVADRAPPAAAECDGWTTVTWSWAWVAAPPGAMAVYKLAPATTGTAVRAHQ
ncbi:MAG TPA: hypothetical protein VHW06_07390 [Streptosporangiaceae bacterium]|jgi:hypothetical protein|nr:hypothetical protein [Streptosporangiaceae bacterium]